MLAANAATELIVVIGKPPAPAVGARIRAKLAGIGKPVVVCLLGRDVIVGREGAVTTVATLEDAALAADAALAGTAWQPRVFSVPEVSRRIAEARRDLGSGQSAVLGLYAGGTLAHESVLIPEPARPGRLQPQRRRGRHWPRPGGRRVRGGARAHSMLDPTTVWR
jgi:succinyl-CoA synthetase alpha subunit